MAQYPQARYWLLTIPHAYFTPYQPNTVSYIKGQLECPLISGHTNSCESWQINGQCDCGGEIPGYLHWQILVIFSRKARLRAVKVLFGDQCHAEPTRSEAASDYVWKEATRVAGTQFELGAPVHRRGNTHDWETIRDSAKRGRLDDIPGDLYCRLYGNFKRIATDHMAPVAVERQIKVFWGRTGSGKSRRAWEEAGMDAFPKDPRTKFWDGYRDHTHVVIDEFRGDIDIAHVLRWFDRYPVIVEVKGASVVLKATHIWLTSNLSPDLWYPLIDPETRAALMRRLEVIEIN